MDTCSLHAFLTGPSLAAAMTTVHEHIRTTALGFTVIRGHWNWFKPMLEACRSATHLCLPYALHAGHFGLLHSSLVQMKHSGK